MDYKETLNLPRTDFPMKADLVRREPERLRQWQSAGLYEQIQAARGGAEKFVLHDGPPFANGDVHIGTALNKILKDIIVKYKTLRGYSAPYVPGWDCHGLPIEFKVSQEMRKQFAAGDPAANSSGADSGNPLPAQDIRKACEAYARKYIDLQREQFKRLGVFGHWDKPYLTLHKEYEADELRLLADLVQKGFVYRGKKPVYWSIPCRTALAEAEVEYKDHLSQSIYVKFPVIGQPGVFIVIWTTTPWTLPANLAVAYNSSFSYSQVRVGGESYLVSSLLLPAVAGKCGWSNSDIVRSLNADELKPLVYHHPFCARTGRLFVGDSFVDNVTGTGFVHIAPGHGLEDYLLGTQNGLPIYSPVDDDGRFAYTNDLPREHQMPMEMVGKSILEKHGKSDANEAVLHELRVRKALLHQENYHHSYPHCWRSKTPVVFRAMDQWFIRIDHVPLEATDAGQPGTAISALAAKDSRTVPASAATFRQQALAAIDQVTWVPAWGVNRIKGAVESRPDWCISRQRAWGVPIPTFYDADGSPILEAQIIRTAADLIEQHGSNVWFEKTCAQLWAALKPKDWHGPEAATKSNDTLDVWIDSGSSSRAVLMRRAELHHPSPGSDRRTPSWQADMYLEGTDQHRGWFQSSLLLSLAGNGAPPFKTVLTNGFVVKASKLDSKQKEKVSKSQQGTYEKPETAERYIRQFGADVVRLWVASQDFRGDIWVGDDRIEKVGETYRLIRNALRYQLSNLYDFDPARHAVPDDQLTGLDRWILARFSTLEADVIQAYDDYEFHVVYQKISQFAAVELSALYHDVVKDRLYTDPANSHRRRSTQTALYRLVTGLCRMLAPILSFTAEEAWEFVPKRGIESVHGTTWRPAEFRVPEAEADLWKSLFRLRESLLPGLEQKRQEKVIGKSLDARIRLVADDSPLATMDKDALAAFRELVNVSQLEFTSNREAEPVVHADGQKCERCWHWETDVGSSSEHPTICGRCVKAVQEYFAAK